VAIFLVAGVTSFLTLRILRHLDIQSLSLILTPVMVIMSFVLIDWSPFGVRLFNNFAVPIILLAMLGTDTLALIYKLATHSGKVRVHTFERSLCGYSWDWREDQPLPVQGPVTVKPDLMQRGDDLLRRNAAAAAAAAENERRRQNR
jgi:hypothetical protein